MDFTPSDPRSIGVELEYQLLDADSFDLVDGIIPLMEFFPDEPYIKPEFIQNTVEVTSGVQYDLVALEVELLRDTARLAERCHDLGMRLGGAGTHPFSERLAALTPLPRYRRMAEVGGVLAHNRITFAIHVHLGMASGDEAMAVMRSLKAYLPILIALSANSPFWSGFDTGYAAFRHRILAAARDYGIPPSFESWTAFTELFGALGRAGLVTTLRSLHWDIRPRPKPGTLEVRVMDVQPTVHQSIVLAGFVRALVFLLRRHAEGNDFSGRLQPLHGCLERCNHFEASRLGMEARLILDERGRTKQLAEVFEMLMEAVAPVAEELGQTAHLQGLRRLVSEGPGYRRQWAAFEAGGSLLHVMADLTQALECELAGLDADINARPGTAILTLPRSQGGAL